MEKVFKKPQIMGILNITADSFYDGGKYLETEKAIEHAMDMIAQGADIIDIGGESMRPGASPIDTATEAERVLPVILQLKKQVPDCIISIDTHKPSVAQRALEAGADMVNDVYALEEIGASLLRDFPRTKIVLMHSKGTPDTMQDDPQYDDIIREMIEYFTERIGFCISKGISEDRLILDPGIGFGKNFGHNMTILKNIQKLKVFDIPLMLGASRKSFINEIYPSQPNERLIGSLASTVIAGLRGVDIVRVHDVREHKQMIDSMWEMI